MEKDILLKVDGVYSGYSGLRVIENVSLEVHPGEVVLLLGSNGAGKTTLLKTISGLLPMDGGSIFLQGNDISAMSIRDRRKHGLTYLSDETYFPTLTILENLRMSLAVHGRNPNGKKIDEVYSIFPELKERSKSKAGSLSGGQRKMLIMAMAMVSDPVLMILDEPSGGLSPVYVEKIIDSMAMLKKSGKSILLAEQNVEFITLADKLYVMDFGRISFSGNPNQAVQDDAIKKAYFNL